MRLEGSRLRRGEWIVAAGAIALLVAMFALSWYGLPGAPGTTARAPDGDASVNAFHGLTVLRWLMLVTIAVAFALVYLQCTRRAPALPVSFSVLLTVLGGVTSVCLIYRVLIDAPDATAQKPGAFLGLACALLLTYGAFRSMRQEDQPDPARNAAIETVHLDRAG